METLDGVVTKLGNLRIENSPQKVRQLAWGTSFLIEASVLELILWPLLEHIPPVGQVISVSLLGTSGSAAFLYNKIKKHEAYNGRLGEAERELVRLELGELSAEQISKNLLKDRIFSYALKCYFGMLGAAALCISAWIYANGKFDLVVPAAGTSSYLLATTFNRLRVYQRALKTNVN